MSAFLGAVFSYCFGSNWVQFERLDCKLDRCLWMSTLWAWYHGFWLSSHLAWTMNEMKGSLDGVRHGWQVSTFGCAFVRWEVCGVRCLKLVQVDGSIWFEGIAAPLFDCDLPGSTMIGWFPGGRYFRQQINSNQHPFLHSAMIYLISLDWFYYVGSSCEALTSYDLIWRWHNSMNRCSFDFQAVLCCSSMCFC